MRFVATEDDEVWRQRITKLRDAVVAASKRVTQAEANHTQALAALQEAQMRRHDSPAALDHALRSRAAECASVLHVSDRKVMKEMNDAHYLVHAFPQTFEALRTASVTVQHAKTILDEASTVGEKHRPDYESRCLQLAISTTPGRLRTKAREIADEFGTVTIDERHRIAASGRCVWVRDLPDGMAELGAVIPAVLAYAVKNRLDQTAKIIKRRVNQNRKTQDTEPLRQKTPASATPALNGADSRSRVDIYNSITHSTTDTDSITDTGTGSDSGSANRTHRRNDPNKPIGSENSILLSDSSNTPESNSDTTGEMRTVTNEFGIRLRSGTELPENYHQLSHEAQQEIRERIKTFEQARQTRSLDTYRADILAELLLTGTPGSTETTSNATMTQDAITGVTANIQLIVPANGDIAHLDGYGPLDSKTARHFTAIAPGWDRMSYNVHGALLATDRRQPTEAMKRILQARDTHCRFPGCHLPARNCEIDHTNEWATGGPTSISNLGHLCARHHHLKHPDLPTENRWQATQNRYGVYTWTSPTGETYTDTPAHPFDASPIDAHPVNTPPLAEHPLREHSLREHPLREQPLREHPFKANPFDTTTPRTIRETRREIPHETTDDLKPPELNNQHPF